MNNFYYVLDNNEICYVEMVDIINNIKKFCINNKKSLGTSYLNYSDKFTKENLLNMTDYDNKCVIIKYDNKWELVEKKIYIVNNGWLFNNIITKKEINILRTYFFIKKDNNKIVFENNINIYDIIENNKFDDIINVSTKFDISLLKSYHLDILFEKCSSIDTIKYFIDNVVDLEYIDENNKKIIDYVIENPTNITFDIIRYLIEKNINLEYQYNDSTKIIHKIMMMYKIKKNNRDIYDKIIRFLINWDINLEYETINKWNLIHYICAYGTTDLIKNVLDKYHNMNILKKYINNQTNSGNTPLHHICMNNITIDIVEYMFMYGAEKYIKNNNDQTPYHCIPYKKKNNFIDILFME